MRTYQTTLASLLLAALMWPAAASAQNVKNKNCNGHTLDGEYADVIVKKKGCTLDGATVFGSVISMGGGILTTTVNGATISGGVQAISAADITLENATVLGEVKLEDSENLEIKAGSSIANVSVKNSGYVKVAAGATTGELNVENTDGSSSDITVDGSVAAIFKTRDGNVALNDATVFPGGVTLLSAGDLTICGSNIGIGGSGGVNMNNSGNLLAVAATDCAASNIEGSVIVEKGTGDVRIVGADLSSGDVNVIEQEGNVTLNGASVSDVKVEKLKGSGRTIELIYVTTDSDTTIKDNDGTVMITGSILGSDVEISQNDAVTMSGSSFSFEDVSVSNNDGPVMIDGNVDLRLTITENNNDVGITNNTFTDADVTKNGDVTISGNTGESLVCSDNSSIVNGGGNNFSFTDGQCSGL